VTQTQRGLACAVALIVAACAGATPQASPGGSVAASGGPSGSAATTAGTSGQPTRGGEVTISAFEDADTLDPTFSGTAGTRLIMINTCEKLYDLDEAGGLVPQLAAEMPVVDGLKMTIKLRENVKFNDGTPFDAAAVVKSLERHRTIAESRRAGELSSISGAAAADPGTVVLTLSKPDAAVIGALSDRAGMIMSPAKLDELGTDFGNFPVCVGPFSFVERVVGDRTVLERSQHYYDAANVYLDRITIRLVADETVRTANLRSGDLQLVDRVATTDVAALEGDSQFVVLKKTSNAYSSLFINLANANGIAGEPGKVTNPLADDRLREAFELALDREQINQIVYTGLHEPGCGPITPASPYFNAPTCTTRDIEAAKKLVAESGVSTPIKVRFQMQATPVNTRLGELIQTQTTEAGFEVELTPFDNATALQNQVDGKFDISLGRWSGRVDPDANIYRFHHSTGSDNYGKASDPDIDTLLDQARAEYDLEARKGLYAQIEEKLRARRNAITFQHEVLYSAHTTALQGYALYVDGMPRLAHAYLSGG
jgi:peptide/nickel transport system substrate-binding protein